jgi:hypothetical protein
MLEFITPTREEGEPGKGPRVNTLIISVEFMGCYLNKDKNIYQN